MRRGLVIGAGGVTGLAWSSATLAALEEATGCDPREADVLVGTSQGALLVSLLASGIGTADLVRWYRRELPATHPLRSKPPAAEPPSDGRARRSLPIAAAPGLAARALLRPGRIPAGVALSGLLPAGKLSLDGFVAPLVALTEPGAWVAHPATRVVAVDFGTGSRVCFGAPDAPRAGVREAVRASCSVPGVYPPTRIGDRSYVDGGVYSSTSVDLVAREGLDEVIVLAPMAGPVQRAPRSPASAVDLVMRRLMQRRLAAECALVREAGARVRVLVPSAEDLAAMGGNPLDPRRRMATFEAAMLSGPERVAAALA